MSDILEKIFALLRYSLFIEEKAPLIEDREWLAIFTLAERHSLLSLIFYGIEKSGMKLPQTFFINGLL